MSISVHRVTLGCDAGHGRLILVRLGLLSFEALPLDLVMPSHPYWTVAITAFVGSSRVGNSWLIGALLLVLQSAATIDQSYEDNQMNPDVRQQAERKLEVNMRTFAIALAFTLIASAAVAQQPAAQTPEQAMKTFSSS